MRICIFSLFTILIFFNYNTAKALQDPVNLYANSDFGMQGDTVSIDIEVNAFADIISFQASLNWDPAMLSYVNVSDFGIKDFGENSFGTTTTDQGHLRFLWEPSDALPLTVSDGTILFSAHFKIITNTPQDVPINFTDQVSNPAFSIEFANSNYEILGVNTQEGSIMVISSPEDVVNLEPTSNTSCDEKVPNGSLKADVHGDSLNYVFHWFQGNVVTSSPDYIGYRYHNIPAGDYTLQIFDGNNVLFVESIAAVVLDESNQQKDVISIISNLPQTSCNTTTARQTGSLEINVNDAQAADTYLISWWEGQFEDGQELAVFIDLYKADNLFAGDYEVVVENISSGCRSYLKETVLEEKQDIQVTLTSTEDNFCKDGANGSASVSIADPDNLNPRYYWYYEIDEMDTVQARFKGQIYENISHGNYKAWVIDLISDCSASETIAVAQNEIFADALITQENDTLFANDDQAKWFRNDIDLQENGLFIVPEQPGNYSITITNEFGCVSESESLYFGITGLEDSNSEITLFPNPFNDFIRVSNRDGLLDFVKIFDLNGTLISENYNIKSKFIDIQLSGSSNGIYLVKIHKDGKVLSRKVVKALSK